MTISLVKHGAPDLSTVGDGTYAPDSAWDGQDHWFYLSQGGLALLNLPAANTLPAGWKIDIRHASPCAGRVNFHPTAAGDKVNGHWTKDSPFDVALNLPQQACELTCDGVSEFFVAGKSFHRNVPQSQRTPIGETNYTVTPYDIDEIIVCDTTQSPDGYIYLHLPAMSTFMPNVTVPNFSGNYLSDVIWVQKVDAGSGYVVIGSDAGEHIGPNNDHLCNPTLDRGFLYLTKQWDTVALRLAADGPKIIAFFRASMIPQGYGI